MPGKKVSLVTAGLLTLVLGAAGLVFSPVADADVVSPEDIAATADNAFNSWNDAFLVQQDGDVYYADTLKSRGTKRAGTWIGALDIAVAADAYQRTHSPAHRQLVNNLVTTFVKHEGRDWRWTGWNDDMAWMILGVLRGYQATGTMDWVNLAASNWNMAYDRGWTTEHGGGGIWMTDNDRFSKCALSNAPMVTAAIQLYQITGDGAYLTKATAIYDWMRTKLLTSSGEMIACLAFPNGSTTPVEQRGDNVYDSGALIEAANLLYRVTGDRTYYDDAVLAARHIVETKPIIHQNQGRGSSYQYRFFRGLTEFCTDNGLCDNYRAYILANANAAWSMRDSANLTWNDWTQPTNAPNPDAFEMASAVAIWQQIPTTTPVPLLGTFQIQNVASNLSMTVKDGSTSEGAAVVQTDDANDPSALWTLVPQSNGHYEIKNVRSSQLLNVTSVSMKLGQPAVQWPAQGTRQGNDQWLPVRNSDGTYSFYNRNSQFALDNPSGGNTVGAQYTQWAPNDGTAQKFNLIQR